MHGMSPATATFLFTDIEGSTQLLNSHRAEYAEILADHHRLLREQFAAYRGNEIGNQGDSFFVTFARARNAVLAAAECQRALARHRWPDGATVRVRMGIHTGEAQQEADRYVGMAIHRAARISAVGHGGQVLVSQITAGLLEDDADLPGIYLKDLGEHRLKDISHPVRLYQLDVAGLPTAFPELAIGDSAAKPPRPGRRSRAVLAALAVVVALVLVAIAMPCAHVQRWPGRRDRPENARAPGRGGRFRQRRVRSRRSARGGGDRLRQRMGRRTRTRSDRATSAGRWFRRRHDPGWSVALRHRGRRRSRLGDERRRRDGRPDRCRDQHRQPDASRRVVAGRDRLRRRRAVGRRPRRRGAPADRPCLRGLGRSRC